MSNSIRVKEAVEEKRLPYFYIFICWYCAKLIENGSLITGLTNDGTVVSAKNTLMHTAMVSAIDDHTQTAVAHRYEDEIREYYRQNARDTEKQAKINNDPKIIKLSIAGDRGVVHEFNRTAIRRETAGIRPIAMHINRAGRRFDRSVSNLKITVHV